MKTSINGLQSHWHASIKAKWRAALPKLADGESVVSANYFTPRSYVDEWNVGSREEGFVYTVRRISPDSVIPQERVVELILRTLKEVPRAGR